ncbi:MAG TPA: serine/threonine protein phosphatase, partial [Coleofasciculaceae cyanobacterium]
MQNPVPLYCPNPQCQAPNQEANRFCQQCHTPIVKRYLWLLGQDTEVFPVGSLLGNRYLVKRPRIVLDTQPGCLPDAPEEIPPEIEPYLRLIAHQFYLPQVYGRVKGEADAAVQPGIPGQWWLLERAPIYPEAVTSQFGDNLEATLIPALASGWAQASALRQLNWLWQISRLWHPLSQEKVARSLLTPELLRIDGSMLRLLELRVDGQSAPTLRDLGALWQNWQPTANPAIASFLQSVC